MSSHSSPQDFEGHEISGPYDHDTNGSSNVEPTCSMPSIETVPATPLFSNQPIHLPLGIRNLNQFDMDFFPVYPSLESCPQTSSAQLMPFPSSLAYFTPVSEPTEVHEALTPVSLHHTMEFHGPDHFSGQHPTPLGSTREVSPMSTQEGSGSMMRPYPRQHTPPNHRRSSRDGLIMESLPSNQLTPATSPRPTPSSTPRIQDPNMIRSGMRHYTPIAPNPIGLQQLQASKRGLSSDDDLEISPAKRKRTSPSSMSPKPSQELSGEDLLLLRLKDEESLTWKDVASRFQSDTGKAYQVPALQMRLKRLRERMRVWTECDVRALRLAHEYWLTNKWDIIASKMSEFGATEKWTYKQCSKKWADMGFAPGPFFDPSHISQAPLYTSSPIETPFSFQAFPHSAMRMESPSTV